MGVFAPLTELAAQYGTPAYVYSRATIERHGQAFDAALSGAGPLLSGSRFGGFGVLLYAVCIVLRLARFNAMLSIDKPDYEQKYFVGMPAPAGAIGTPSAGKGLTTRSRPNSQKIGVRKADRATSRPRVRSMGRAHPRSGNPA